MNLTKMRKVCIKILRREGKVFSEVSSKNFSSLFNFARNLLKQKSQINVNPPEFTNKSPND
jgi:hypothetical protein